MGTVKLYREDTFVKADVVDVVEGDEHEHQPHCGRGGVDGIVHAVRMRSQLSEYVQPQQHGRNWRREGNTVLESLYLCIAVTWV